MKAKSQLTITREEIAAELRKQLRFFRNTDSPNSKLTTLRKINSLYKDFFATYPSISNFNSDKYEDIRAIIDIRQTLKFGVVETMRINEIKDDPYFQDHPALLLQFINAGRVNETATVFETQIAKLREVLLGRSREELDVKFLNTVVKLIKDDPAAAKLLFPTQPEKVNIEYLRNKFNNDPVTTGNLNFILTTTERAYITLREVLLGSSENKLDAKFLNTFVESIKKNPEEIKKLFPQETKKLKIDKLIKDFKNDDVTIANLKFIQNAAKKIHDSRFSSFFRKVPVRTRELTDINKFAVQHLNTAIDTLVQGQDSKKESVRKIREIFNKVQEEYQYLPLEPKHQYTQIYLTALKDLNNIRWELKANGKDKALIHQLDTLLRHELNLSPEKKVVDFSKNKPEISKAFDPINRTLDKLSKELTETLTFTPTIDKK